MTDSVFARIIDRSVPADIVYEDERVVAFRDIHPRAPVHILVVPREPIATLNDADASHEALLGHMMLTAARVAREAGLEKGYRLVMNCREHGGQTVWHLHLHVLGGRPMKWPPG